jgi:hypothetical protein
LTALAADENVKDQNGWGNMPVAQQPGYWEDIPPHRWGGKFPAGGNEVFVDDSVQWIKYQQMYCFHTYQVLPCVTSFGIRIRLISWIRLQPLRQQI